MKYIMSGCLITFIAFVVIALSYKYFFAQPLPESFLRAIQNQHNPFVSSKDSADIFWNRAKQFLESRKLLIGGGDLQENDTLLFIPYYDHYHKGDCIKIEKHVTPDSVIFYCQWWYSQQYNESGSKEIALFMQHKIDRYKL